jgi:hypothetical protein
MMPLLLDRNAFVKFGLRHLYNLFYQSVKRNHTRIVAFVLSWTVFLGCSRDLLFSIQPVAPCLLASYMLDVSR